jgi:hypothetical protein
MREEVPLSRCRNLTTSHHTVPYHLCTASDLCTARFCHVLGHVGIRLAMWMFAQSCVILHWHVRLHEHEVACKDMACSLDTAHGVFR